MPFGSFLCSSAMVPVVTAWPFALGGTVSTLRGRWGWSWGSDTQFLRPLGSPAASFQ